MDVGPLLTDLLHRLITLGEQEVADAIRLASEIGSTGSEAMDNLSRELSEHRDDLIARYPQLEPVITEILKELHNGH